MGCAASAAYSAAAAAFHGSADDMDPNLGDMAADLAGRTARSLHRLASCGGGGGGGGGSGGGGWDAAVDGRGLHSFTFELNVSAFCGIGGASKGCLGGV